VAGPSVSSTMYMELIADPPTQKAQLVHGEGNTLLEDFSPDDCFLVQHSATQI
jgi:hypothetical protein